MAIEGVNYEDSSYYNKNRITSSTAIQGKDASQMGMDDFMQLLVAQMTNQDMMDPADNTEMVAQMAQFSALQGIQTIQEYQLSSYASSYAGKYVTIAHVNELGSMETITGQVETVTFYDGKPKVVVNGKSYDLHTVMEVAASASAGSLTEAAQYIGKTVTVATKNEFGETKEIIGFVTGITMKDNKPHVIIDGDEYPLTSVTKVHEAEAEDTESGDEDQGSKMESQAATNRANYQVPDEINDM